jgi:hypothetical protein
MMEDGRELNTRSGPLRFLDTHVLPRVPAALENRFERLVAFTLDAIDRSTDVSHLSSRKPGLTNRPSLRSKERVLNPTIMTLDALGKRIGE